MNRASPPAALPGAGPDSFSGVLAQAMVAPGLAASDSTKPAASVTEHSEASRAPAASEPEQEEPTTPPVEVPDPSQGLLLTAPELAPQLPELAPFQGPAGQPAPPAPFLLPGDQSSDIPAVPDKGDPLTPIGSPPGLSGPSSTEVSSPPGAPPSRPAAPTPPASVPGPLAAAWKPPLGASGGDERATLPLPASGDAVLPPSMPDASAIPPPSAFAAPPTLLSGRAPTPELAPPPPAVQVGPALASFTIRAAQPGAPQSMVIRLDPIELGRVQVSIERLPGAPARVDLIVERADTLLLLLRDQPQLHRALDLAGVPATDRILQLHLAPQGAAPPSTASDPTAPDANGQFGSGFANGQQAGDPHARSAPHRGPSHQGPGLGAASHADDPASRPAAAWRRAGVDIMA